MTATCSVLATPIPSDEKGSSGRKYRQQRTPTITTGGSVTRGLNRRCSSVSGAPGAQPLTISRLSDLLATCTYDKYTTIIHHMPEGWIAMNDRGNIVTKCQLEMAQWGAYKDDHNVLKFQQTIMSTKQHTTKVTQ